MGVILTRLAGFPLDQKAELVSTVNGQHLSELENSFAGITPCSIRIRRSDQY
jgi:hypothetical protein